MYVCVNRNELTGADNWCLMCSNNLYTRCSRSILLPLFKILSNLTAHDPPWSEAFIIRARLKGPACPDSGGSIYRIHHKWDIICIARISLVYNQFIDNLNTSLSFC